VALAAVLFALGAAAGSAVLSLGPTTPWVVAPFANAADQVAFDLALRDVKRDWYAALGLPPILLPSSAAIPPASSLSAPNPVLFFGQFSVLAAQLDLSTLPAPEAPEGWLLAALPFNASAGFLPIVFAGSDVLGSVYAAYALSHVVLGVNPQGFWVDEPVAFSGEVQVPVDLLVLTPPPAFRYRGFFINDEDQLGGFHADPLGEAVFSLEAWDRVFQTVLRLGGNAVIVGTCAFPDERSLDLASRRGLWLAEHHITLLGTNTFQWPKGLPYNFADNPDVVTHVWGVSARVQIERQRKMLWTVGYRGLNDYPFWFDDPAYNTSASRGALISAAIQTQVDLVLNISSELFGPTYAAQQQFFTYLWDEMQALYYGGFLKIPPQVTVVHADTGLGILNFTNVAPGEGVYYHVAMENGKENQLTEMVSPARIFQNLTPFVQRGAVKYIIINTSDLRAVVLSTKAVMDFAWNPSPWMAGDPVSAQSAWLNAWTARNFDAQQPSLASNLSALYADYFAVDYMAEPPYVGEQYLAASVRTLAQSVTEYVLDNAPLPTGDAKGYQELVASAVKQLETLDTSVSSLASQIPSPRQPFFQAHLAAQGMRRKRPRAPIVPALTFAPVRMQLTSCYALCNVSNAVLSLASGSRAGAIDALQQTLQSLQMFFEAERFAETGVRWQGWFAYEELDGYFNVNDEVNRALAAVQLGPGSRACLPPARFWQYGTGTWSSEFQYEFARPSNFPLFYFNSSYIMDGAVSIACAPQQPVLCAVTAIGAEFEGASEALFVLQTPAGDIDIRFTLDGSTPTNTSALFTAPFPVGLGRTIVSAAAFRGGVAVLPVTRAVVNGVAAGVRAF
jgi:hypothetical protein